MMFPIAACANRSIRLGVRCLVRRRSSSASISVGVNRYPTTQNYFCNTQYHRTQTIHHSFSTATSASSTEEEDEDTIIQDGLETLPGLSSSMQSRIRSLKNRHDEILSQLQDGGDQTSLGKELSNLSGISTLYEQVNDIHLERESLLELLNETQQQSDDSDNKEMIDEINDELSQLEIQLPNISQRMLNFIVPLLNPDDVDELTSSDAVIDIRAGTGGDEACLFAAELYNAYESISKAGGGDEHGNGTKSWDLEVLSVSTTDLGGIKEASLVVSSRSSGGGGGGGGYGGYDNFDTDSSNGQDNTAQLLLNKLGPYGYFQYESGVHRVQRVPVNDVKMQTSAVSVAVLPSVPDNKVAQALPPTELKIDTMRASGAGGQHVNTTESAVRVTHTPTGIMAYMQEERSQHKNKSKALRLVAARVHQYKKEQALASRSSARSSLMGGGDRSERIRTYNFSQDRITDHRCKISIQGISSWLGSGTHVPKFSPSLYQMEREERVVALEEEDNADDKNNDKKRSGKNRKGKGGNKK